MEAYGILLSVLKYREDVLTQATKTTGKVKAGYSGPFDELSFYLGRAFYDHIKLLEVLLEETGLDKHLAPGMGQILFNLFEEDDVIIKELTESLRVSPSHLTAVLGRMEKAGVITRRRDENDGRAVRVKLTKLGRSTKKTCRAMLRNLNEVLAAGMTEREVRKIKKQLELMARNVADYRNK